MVFLALLCLPAFILAILAFARSGKTNSLEREARRLAAELATLQGRVALLEREKRNPTPPSTESASEATLPVPQPSVSIVPSAPPVVALVPRPQPQPEVAVPEPPPVQPVTLPAAILEPVAPPTVPPRPAPAPERLTAPAARVLPPVPRPLPSIPSPTSQPPQRNLEDFLGTQLFLKVGVGILVIGVVFAMGLVFQMVGPIGKVLLGYGGGLALLGAGISFERKERFRTFGRALIAGAWGILYFVTFAAGFVETSRVFHTRLGAVLALLVAGSAAVGYSLRYRHEWTTIFAFLLIHLSLGIAAFHLPPAQNLTATLIVALAIAVLVWRRGWVRLLALGAAATWASLSLWMVPRAPGDLSLLPVTLLVAGAFQAAILLMEVEEADFSWLGLAQLANFLVPLGLCLREALPGGNAWLWALGFGLVGIGCAFAHGRKRRHGLFLLTATEGLAALALVTPLRLGLHHELTPLMRLLGLELLLAAGVFLRERYFRILAYCGFGLTLLELLLIRAEVPGPGRALLLGATALLFLLNAGLLRTWWRETCEGELPALAWSFSLAGTLCLAVLLGVELPLRWLAPAYGGLALLWVIVALWRGLGDVVAEASALAIAAVIALLVLNFGFPAPSEGRVLSASLAGGTLAVAYLASRLGRSVRLEPQWATFLQGLFSFLALGCGVLLVLRELPAPWPPPVLVAAGLLLLLAGLRLRWNELTMEGLVLGPVALLTALPHLQFTGGASFHLPKRAWMLGLLAAGALGKEMLLRTWSHAWPWGEAGRKALVGAYGVAGALLLTALILLEVPTPLVAAAFMVLSGLYLLWARRTSSTLRCYLSMTFLGLGFLTILTHAWGGSGLLGVFPARLASVGMALLLAYGVQVLYHRISSQQTPLGELLPGTLSAAAAVTLVACSLVLGVLIKLEALDHGKNLLVAPAWALLGVLYLERGRAIEDKAWRTLGHLWMGVAFAHFLAVNLVQPGELGPVSLRLATGLPFLCLYLYTYLTWDTEAATPLESPSLRWGYFYALQLAVALLVLYEIHRAWVLPLWALQGLVSLGWGLHKENPHWLRSALILAMAALFRGLGTNLYLRDELRELRLNWITVPLAVIFLLAGYVALNRNRDSGEAEGLEGFGAGYNRFPWFAAQAILLFALIWVEISGTELTVWLSGFGLGMVSLGFLLQERVARFTGLGILSACILKLFFYDLRGLSGLPRVLSFIVLGGVLIAVSYTYTRFKERLEKLL